MQRRIATPLGTADRAAMATWSRRKFGLCALVLAAVIAWPSIQRLGGDDEEANVAPRAAACLDWDAAARGAVGQLVNGPRDLDLRQVGDAVFRMRRARRNCQAGWINLACRDYDAIVRGTPGASLPPSGHLAGCGALLNVETSAMQTAKR
jgi:hypothetical protein